MSGLFGVVSKKNCIVDVFFGTDYHSHLGTRRAGIAMFDGERFDRSIHNIENTPFRTKFDKDVKEMEGIMGIGCISDYSSGRNRYIGYLISLAKHSMKSLKIGLDAANGASWMIAKSVFDALGAQTVIINNVGEFLPPELEEFLKTFDKSKNHLYLRTKVPNPKFSPEVSTSVNIINFLVNDKGLEEQILR